jgi:hypothetical protein
MFENIRYYSGSAFSGGVHHSLSTYFKLDETSCNLLRCNGRYVPSRMVFYEDVREAGALTSATTEKAGYAGMRANTPHSCFFIYSS